MTHKFFSLLVSMGVMLVACESGKFVGTGNPPVKNKADTGATTGDATGTQNGGGGGTSTDPNNPNGTTPSGTSTDGNNGTSTNNQQGTGTSKDVNPGGTPTPGGAGATPTPAPTATPIPTPICSGGADLDGVCWYLSGTSGDCSVCNDKGGVNTQTWTNAASSPQACIRIANALHLRVDRTDAVTYQQRSASAPNPGIISRVDACGYTDGWGVYVLNVLYGGGGQGYLGEGYVKMICACNKR